MSGVASCPACDKEIRLPAGAAGRRVKCGDCDTVSRIGDDGGGGYLLEAETGTAPPAAPSPRGAGAPPRRRPAKTRVVAVPLDTEDLARGSAKSSHRQRRGRGGKMRMPGMVIGACMGLGIQVGLNILGLLLLLGVSSELDQFGEAAVLAGKVMAAVLAFIVLIQLIVLAGLVLRSRVARVGAVIIEIISALTSLYLVATSESRIPNLLGMLLAVSVLVLVVATQSTPWFEGDEVAPRRSGGGRTPRRRRR